MADPILNGLYPKQLDELLTIALDAWIVFQPDGVDDQAYRISLTNFIAALPVIPAVAGEYDNIADLLTAQPGQTIDVLYRVIDPIADPAFNDLPDAEVKSVYYHLPGAKTGSLDDYNSIAFPKLGSNKNAKLGNSLDAFTFDIKFRTAEWSSNQATLQAAANALNLNSPQDLKLTGESVKLITGNDPSEISRVLLGLDGQLIFEPIEASKIQSDSDSGDVILDDIYQEILTLTGSENIALALANIGLTAKSITTGSITAFADASDGRITVTSATHGHSEGDFVEIVNTTNYNGTYEIKSVPNINDFIITKAFVATETGDWEKSANREISVDLRVNEISAKVFTRQIEGEGRLNFSEQLSGLVSGEDIDVWVKSNTVDEEIELLGTTQSSELKVINFDINHDYKIWHVDLNGGSDANTGGVNDPFKQPQAAYDAAVVIGSGSYIIRIMTAGTYAGLVMDDDNVWVYVQGAVKGINLGGLTCSDVAFYVDNIETIGNTILNQTATNWLGGTFDNCNCGIITGSVNDQGNTQIIFQGVRTAAELTASAPDINILNRFQAKLTAHKDTVLTDLSLDLNTSLHLDGGNGAGNVTITNLIVFYGHINGNSLVTLTVTGAYTAVGVKYVLKDHLIISGTRSEITGEWAEGWNPLTGFEIDGFSFLQKNIVIVDNILGNDTIGTIGGASFKTIEAAAAAARTAYLANPEDKYLVYIRAFDGVYDVVSVDGAVTYPEIHYYTESKCIIRSVGTGNKPFGDFTNGAGNYFFHGKGEWYNSATVVFGQTFAFTEASNVFLSASVVQGIGILENNTITPLPRAKLELHIDTLLTTGNFQSNGSKDLGGSNVKWYGTDFIGGLWWGTFWQRSAKHYYERCKFRLSPAIHNPTNGEWEVYDKSGNLLFTIDMTDTDQSRQSRLADFSLLADVQATVDKALIIDERVACVEIELNNDIFDLQFTWIDCEFYIDQDKAIGVKIMVTTSLDAGRSVFKLIRPRFIDISGGTTTAITAWKDGAYSDPQIYVEKPESNADVYNTSHTSNANIEILNPLAELNKESTSDQSIASKVEFKSQAHANNAANAIKDFSATPTFDFDADGNDQEMPVTGNVTSFAVSNAVGSANYSVWLINDGTPGRTVAAPTGSTEMASSDTHDTAANAINLYQFKTRPGGALYHSILNV